MSQGQSTRLRALLRASPTCWNNAEDRNQVASWSWWSYECHRQSHSASGSAPRETARPYRYPWNDRCVQDEADFRRLSSLQSASQDSTKRNPPWESWAGSWPASKHTSRALMFFTQPTLLHRECSVVECSALPSLYIILLEILASIASLELRWDIRLWLFHNSRTMVHHERHLALLPGRFLSLRRLILCFSHFFLVSFVGPTSARAA